MRNKMTWVAVLGGALWIAGAIGGFFDDMEYEGVIDDSPISGWVTAGAILIGSLLLLVVLSAFDKAHRDAATSVSRPAYWIAMTGLGVTLVAVWPFVILGPFLAGFGLTLYAIERIRRGGAETAGAWLHASCFPGAIVVGVVTSFFNFEFNTGTLGVIAFVALIASGFVMMGLSLERNPSANLRDVATPMGEVV